MQNYYTSNKAPNQSISDANYRCIDHMSSNGIPPVGSIIPDGKFHRWSIQGDADKSEWYNATEFQWSNGKTALKCNYGTWKGDLKFYFKSWENNKEYSSDDRSRLEVLSKEHDLKLAEQERQFEIERSNDAQHIWDKCPTVPPSTDYLHYLSNKNLDPSGCRYVLGPNQKPSIVIPIIDENHKIWSLQYLFAPGKDGKRFMRGARKKGFFHLIGHNESASEVVIVEGWATGLSVHLATKLPVFCALSANSIKDVIPRIQIMYPGKPIIIAGDNDIKVGMPSAKQAAESFANCRVVFPVMPLGKEGKDFDDLRFHSSLEEVKRQIDGAYRPPSIQDRINELVVGLSRIDDPCASFNLESTPELMRNYIRAEMETTAAHPLTIATALIATHVSFIGKEVTVYANGYNHLNLWMLTISGSGTFKSTALNRGSKLLYERSSNVSLAIRDKQQHLRVPNASVRDYPELLELSLKDYLLPDNATPEATFEHLSQGHRGTMILSEFGSLLQSMEAKYNATLKSKLTDYYDVPPARRTKTRSNGDLVLERPYISICGTSTMNWITPYVKKEDIYSGFFARFLIYIPAQKAERPPLYLKPPEKKNESATDAVRKHLEEIENMTAEFYLESEAGILFDQLFHLIHDIPSSYDKDLGELIKIFIPRWIADLSKFSADMQIWIDPKSSTISPMAVGYAANFLFPAIKSTIKLISGSLAESIWQRQVRELFDWIVQKAVKINGPVPWKEITKSNKMDKGVQDYERAVNDLAQQGKLEFHKAEKRNDCSYMPI